MSQLKNLDIAIYLRKSRADVELEKEAAKYGESFDTLTKHRRELLSLAKQGNHNIIDIFEEVVSGEFIAERPEMQQLLINTKALKYDAVLVMDIDRLGRGDKIDQGRIERALKESQTLIITPSEVYDLNDESGEFNVEVRTFLARFEYKKIKKRLQGGRVRAAKEGKDVGQKPPYGYHKDRMKFLQINEEEAKIVQLIFQWCIEGIGRNLIAERLTDMGIPSPSGKKIWSNVTVMKIIKNPKYKGDQIYGRVRWMKQEDGTYKTKIVKDPSQYTVKENAHDAIIDPDTWEKAQEAMQRRTKAPVKQNLEIVNPFAGIIKCKKCGKAILANNPSNRPNKYLFCGTPGCKQKMIALNKVEDVVLAQLETILTTLRANSKKRPTKTELDTVLEMHLKRVDRIKEDLERTQKQKDRLHDLLEDGTYDKDTFLERIGKVQDKFKELEQDLLKAEALLANESVKRNQQKNIIPNISKALASYNSTSSIVEKNKILKTFIKEIRYNRESEWKGAYEFEVEIELYE